jgi:hypothetical protein
MRSSAAQQQAAAASSTWSTRRRVPACLCRILVPQFNSAVTTRLADVLGRPSPCPNRPLITQTPPPCPPFASMPSPQVPTSRRPCQRLSPPVLTRTRQTPRSGVCCRSCSGRSAPRCTSPSSASTPSQTTATRWERPTVSSACPQPHTQPLCRARSLNFRTVAPW